MDRDGLYGADTQRSFYVYCVSDGVSEVGHQAYLEGYSGETGLSWLVAQDSANNTESHLCSRR